MQVREPRESRRVEEVRERREVRVMTDESRGRVVEERRHRVEEHYIQQEAPMDRPDRVKRHKRSHKYERNREREVQDKGREFAHQDKHYQEVSMEDAVDMDEEVELDMGSVPLGEPKDPKEMTEQELRRAK